MLFNKIPMTNPLIYWSVYQPINTHAKRATRTLDAKDKKLISSQLSKTNASIQSNNHQEVTAASH